MQHLQPYHAQPAAAAASAPQVGGQGEDEEEDSDGWDDSDSDAEEEGREAGKPGSDKGEGEDGGEGEGGDGNTTGGEGGGGKGGKEGGKGGKKKEEGYDYFDEFIDDEGGWEERAVPAVRCMGRLGWQPIVQPAKRHGWRAHTQRRRHPPAEFIQLTEHDKRKPKHTGFFISKVPAVRLACRAPAAQPVQAFGSSACRLLRQQHAMPECLPLLPPLQPAGRD